MSKLLQHNPKAKDATKALGGAKAAAEYFKVGRDAPYKWYKHDPDAILHDHLFHYMWYHSPHLFVKTKPAGWKK